MIRGIVRELALAGSVALAPLPALAQVRTDGDPIALAAVESFFDQARIGMIGLVVVIVAALVFASLRERRKQELLARFADKGQEIPRELLPTPPSPHREMRRGVWILSLGLGLGLVLFFATNDWAIAAWSLIPLFLGAAAFINAAFFYPKSVNGQ